MAIDADMETKNTVNWRWSRLIPQARYEPPPFVDEEGPLADDPSFKLYCSFRNSPPLKAMVPTLDGPRLHPFHVVPAKRLQECHPRERWLVQWHEKSFISGLLPPEFRRYALSYLYHRDSKWCKSPQEPLRQLTSGSPYDRALEIELSLAKAEMTPDQYKAYREWRRPTFQGWFFGQSEPELEQAEKRIQRLVGVWEAAEISAGRLP